MRWCSCSTSRSPLLEAAGLAVSADFEARTLWGALSGRSDHPPRDGVDTELARDPIQTGSEFILMRRDQHRKIVLYLDDAVGEPYDLQVDPAQNDNLWHAEALHALGDKLAVACMRWLARSSPRSHGCASRAPQQAMRNETTRRSAPRVSTEFLGTPAAYRRHLPKQPYFVIPG
jgi:hypothetical protein